MQLQYNSKTFNNFFKNQINVDKWLDLAGESVLIDEGPDVTLVPSLSIDIDQSSRPSRSAASSSIHHNHYHHHPSQICLLAILIAASSLFHWFSSSLPSTRLLRIFGKQNYISNFSGQFFVLFLPFLISFFFKMMTFFSMCLYISS